MKGVREVYEAPSIIIIGHAWTEPTPTPAPALCNHVRFIMQRGATIQMQTRIRAARVNVRAKSKRYVSRATSILTFHPILLNLPVPQLYQLH